MKSSRLALLLALCACAAKPPASVPQEVVVFAAASLGPALQELGRDYEAAMGEAVVFSFGASSDLARQIRAGAPADVFFSADLARMDEVEKAGSVRPEERVNLLSNSLVIVAPASSPLSIGGPADLRKVKRLALANPESVPAGVYARTYLESLGLWESLRAKVVPTLDVRAALAAVESENADAAVVYRTDALLSKRVKVVHEVPREKGPRIVYPVAPLARSRKAGARRFVGYLTSPSARAVFERYGFVVLDRAAAP